jgi:hypothetical protein
LDGQQQALRRYYGRLLALLPSFGEAADPDGLGYYDLTGAKEWSSRPVDVRQWVHAMVRVGGGKKRALVVSNFSDHDQTVQLPLLPNGSKAMLTDMGILDDDTIYTFTEELATEDEDGKPRQVSLSAKWKDLYAKGEISIVVPRWTGSVLTVSP